MQIPLRFSPHFVAQNVSIVKMTIDLKIVSILLHSVCQLITQIQQNATVSSQMAITAKSSWKNVLDEHVLYNSRVNRIELDWQISHIKITVGLVVCAHCVHCVHCTRSTKISALSDCRQNWWFSMQMRVRTFHFLSFSKHNSINKYPFDWQSRKGIKIKKWNLSQQSTAKWIECKEIIKWFAFCLQNDVFVLGIRKEMDVRMWVVFATICITIVPMQAKAIPSFGWKWFKTFIYKD